MTTPRRSAARTPKERVLQNFWQRLVHRAVAKAPHAKDLAVYSQLERNWNSYGAMPFSAETLKLAAEISSKLGAEWVTIPTAGGAVMFCRNGDDETVEVHAAAPDKEKPK